METLIAKIENQNVVAYDVSFDNLPAALFNKLKGNVEYCHDEVGKDFKVEVFNKVMNYSGLDDIRRRSGNVALLGEHAKLSSVYSYPYSSEFVCFQLQFDRYFVFFFIGILRRLVYGRTRNNSRIRYLGVTTLRAVNGRSVKWLVFQNANANIPTHYSINKNIGIDGLIQYLKKNEIKYTFLRFFEKLPELHRDGGDLDILVSDEDHIKVSSYLTDNQGEIPVDLYSVSKPASETMISYYPPLIARAMLERSVFDANGAMILSNLDYALSFLYHIVYHKGGTSGLPTEILLRQHYSRPDNDYLNHANNLLASVNLPAISSIEDAEKVLDDHGWKPKLDTLHFLARTNEWVKIKYFKDKFTDYGLGVFVLKKGFFKTSDLAQFTNEVNSLGYDVLDAQLCGEKLGDLIYRELRGGNWAEVGDTAENCEPAAFVVVLKVTSRTNATMRDLKSKLRIKFDRTTNYIHGTDNSRFSEEYLNVIYSGNLPSNISCLVENQKGNIKTEISLSYNLLNKFYRKRSQFIDHLQGMVKKMLVRKYR